MIDIPSLDGDGVVWQGAPRGRARFLMTGDKRYPGRPHPLGGARPRRQNEESVVAANMTEREKLMELLFEDGTKLVNLKCFPGNDSSVSHDAICAQLRSAILQKHNGTATVSARFNDDAVKVDVRARLAELAA